MTEILPVSKPQLASKWRAVESGSPEKVPGKGAFYYINHHNSGTFSGHPVSTATRFPNNLYKKPPRQTSWYAENLM